MCPFLDVLSQLMLLARALKHRVLKEEGWEDSWTSLEGVGQQGEEEAWQEDSLTSWEGEEQHQEEEEGAC